MTVSSLLLLMALATPEPHVAVIVGVDDYGAPELNLNSPLKDVEALADGLNGTAFDVRRIENVEREAFVASLLAAKKAVAKGVVLFYFSGHAIQVDGENYLIPKGAHLKNVDEVPIEAVSIRQVLQVFSDARLKIVILDACRTNPFGLGAKGARPGLARERLDDLQGTFISYAAAPGSVAYDGVPGMPSPFTQALVRNIKTPGVDLPNLFMLVRSDLVAHTESLPNGPQRSEELSSLMAEHRFEFVEPVKEGGTKGGAPHASAAAVGSGPSGALVFSLTATTVGVIATGAGAIVAATENNIVVDPRTIAQGGFTGPEKRQAEDARNLAVGLAGVGALASIVGGTATVFTWGNE